MRGKYRTEITSERNVQGQTLQVRGMYKPFKRWKVNLNFGDNRQTDRQTPQIVDSRAALFAAKKEI